jgi:hypothetical protein
MSVEVLAQVPLHVRAAQFKCIGLKTLRKWTHWVHSPFSAFLLPLYSLLEYRKGARNAHHVMDGALSLNRKDWGTTLGEGHK